MISIRVLSHNYSFIFQCIYIFFNTLINFHNLLISLLQSVAHFPYFRHPNYRLHTPYSVSIHLLLVIVKYSFRFFMLFYNSLSYYFIIVFLHIYFKKLLFYEMDSLLLLPQYISTFLLLSMLKLFIYLFYHMILINLKFRYINVCVYILHMLYSSQSMASFFSFL